MAAGLPLFRLLSPAGADEWLSEATFLTGNGPGEAIDKVTDSPEEARIVKVRPCKLGPTVNNTGVPLQAYLIVAPALHEDDERKACGIIASETSCWLVCVLEPKKGRSRSLSTCFVCMQRRLIIGAVVTVIAAGLSVLPTDALRFSRPSKPLFFYLTPLVRVQSLLGDLEKAAQEGETDGQSLLQPSALWSQGETKGSQGRKLLSLVKVDSMAVLASSKAETGNKALKSQYSSIQRHSHTFHSSTTGIFFSGLV